MAECPPLSDPWKEFARWQGLLERCREIDKSLGLEELLHALADRLAVYDGPLAPGELRRVRSMARNRDRKHRRRRDLEALAAQLGEHHFFRHNGEVVGYPAGQISPAKRAALKDEAERVLSLLSDREKAIFLRMIDNWSSAEIAKDLGICPSAVRMCVTRCRERLAGVRIAAPRARPGRIAEGGVPGAGIGDGDQRAAG